MLTLGVGPLLTLTWTAESDEAAYFGNAVSSAGDVNGDGYGDVVVGAWGSSAAFVYLGSASGLETTEAWMTELADASYGRAVSSGDVNGDGYDDVVVGAPLYDNGSSDEGGAFVYLGSVAGPRTIAAWTAESDQDGASFGYSVSTADVNGDGYDDVVVGANLYDNGSTDAGKAYLYLGSAAGLETTAAWTAEADEDIAEFGRTVSSAGDVNGDGYDDVLVGAWTNRFGAPPGRAYLYLGSASGLETTAAWTAEGDEGNALGSVSSAGDVNGDGYDDVVVGDWWYDNGQTNEGGAFLYLGSASGLATTATWSGESNQEHSHYGMDVSSAGDVNGDGYDDVVVGNWAYDIEVVGGSNDGMVHLYYGSETGLQATAAWTAVSDQLGAGFGWSVSTAGDVNGDTYDDVVVGAWTYDNASGSTGKVFLYAGAPDADRDGLSPADDCDDEDPMAYPGAIERCDGLDNSCQGSVDPTELDEDGDGERICAGDCDDAEPTVHGSAEEVCNGFDDDCDGGVDESCDVDETDPGCGCNGTSVDYGVQLLALGVSGVAIARRRRRDPTTTA